MSEWICSRVLIVRPENVQLFMPTCVLENILICHGIQYKENMLEEYFYRKQVIEHIKDLNPMIINVPLGTYDYKTLGNFINPREKKWNKKSMFESYRFLESFQSQDKRFTWQDVPDIYNIGPLHLNNTTAIDECVLYRLCCDAGLHPSIVATTNDMHQALLYIKDGIGSLDIDVSHEILHPEIPLIQKIDKWIFYHQEPSRNSTNGFGFNQNKNAWHKGHLHFAQEVKGTEYNGKYRKQNKPKYKKYNTNFVNNDNDVCDEMEFKKMIKTEDRVTFSILQLWADNLSLPVKFRNIIPPIVSHLRPYSILDAIGFGAYYFEVDLSSTEEPILEFFNLLSDYNEFGSIQKWNPLSKQCRKYKILNPSLYSLSESFNPIFPSIFYSWESLANLGKRKGLTDFSMNEFLQDSISRDSITLRTEIQEIYQNLQIKTLLSGFYIGIYPEIQNDTTPVYWEELKRIKPSLILCYGERYNQLTAFSFQEWIDHIQHTKSFQNLQCREEDLSSSTIKDLKRLLNEYIDGTNFKVAKSVRSIYKELLHAIEDVEFINASASKTIRKFYDKYISLESKQQDEIVTILQLLLKIGLTMRGWDSETTHYPIEEALVEDNLLVDKRTGDTLHEYNSCESKFIADVNRLPLLNYRNGKYDFSSSINEGYTIGERMDIVVQGNRTDNIHSCIRMTSNWFVSSAYRYLTLLKQEVPFDISKLRQIS
jgi:hypothetical protein